MQRKHRYKVTDFYKNVTMHLSGGFENFKEPFFLLSYCFDIQITMSTYSYI